MILGSNYVAIPLEVPKPGTPLQAFVCATKTSKNVRGPLAVGARVARSSGIIAGNDPFVALWDCDEWPLQVYEVVVDPADLFLGSGELLLKTSAFRVVREVPLEEVFGPRASELGPSFDDIRTLPWLAPKRAPDADTLTRLVHEVYESAGERGIGRVRVGLVQDWRDACAADQRVTEQKGSPTALIKGARAARPPLSEDEEERRSLCTRVLRCILFRQSYVRAWEAGWEVAFNASLRASMKQNRPGDAKAAKRAWAKLRDKATSRRDASRRAAFRTAQHMLEALPHNEVADLDPSFEELHAAGMSDVATDAWNFSLSAMITAIDVLETPVHEAERSPSKPLLELFRMGLWPIGEVGGLFAIYTPTPMSSHGTTAKV